MEGWSKTRRSFQHVCKLIRGVAIWQMWLARNAKVFENVSQSDEELRHRMWEGILDYGRIAWEKNTKGDQ